MTFGAQLSIDDERKARMEVLRQHLHAIAVEMLADDARSADRPTHGVTFDQVRIRAETRGLLTGEEKGRTLSFGSTLMKSAGGVPCEYRRSKHRNSHGRLVAVYRLASVAHG